jgi:hypothetical protein
MPGSLIVHFIDIHEFDRRACALICTIIAIAIVYWAYSVHRQFPDSAIAFGLIWGKAIFNLNFENESTIRISTAIHLCTTSNKFFVGMMLKKVSGTEHISMVTSKMLYIKNKPTDKHSKWFISDRLIS